MRSSVKKEMTLEIKNGPPYIFSGLIEMWMKKLYTLL